MAGFLEAILAVLPYSIQAVHGLDKLAEKLLKAAANSRADKEKIKTLLDFLKRGKPALGEGWEEGCVNTLLGKLVSSGALHEFDLRLARTWLGQIAPALLNGIIISETIEGVRTGRTEPEKPSMQERSSALRERPALERRPIHAPPSRVTGQFMPSEMVKHLQTPLPPNAFPEANFMAGMSTQPTDDSFQPTQTSTQGSDFTQPLMPEDAVRTLHSRGRNENGRKRPYPSPEELREAKHLRG
jgi:hypothetical protein